MQRTLTAAFGLLVAGGIQVVTAQAPTAPTPSAQAPAPALEIRGKVIDSKSEAPIARASVTVRPKGGTTVLAGAIAGADGSFRIQGMRPGTYSLRTTFIGFAPLVQDVVVTPASPVTSIGVIKLSQVAVSLSTMEVTE